MNLSEEQCVEDLADLLYDFLPGSGNTRTAFPLAAAATQTDDFWIGGSKRPAIVHLLSVTLRRRRHKFGPLILAIVRQSMTWRRGKQNPLTRSEIEQLNALLLRISLKIPELHDHDFLASFPSEETKPKASTGMSSLSGFTAAICMVEPMSIAAAPGLTIFKAGWSPLVVFIMASPPFILEGLGRASPSSS